MDIETMQKIVDGAPEWAKIFNVHNKVYGRGGIQCKGNILLSDLRAELAKHDTLDLEPADIPHGTIVLER